MEFSWQFVASWGFQLAALAILGPAAIEPLLAVWAATSRRHWFWRALVVWSGIALLVPIRAYEPALLIAVSSTLIVLVLSLGRMLTSRRLPTAQDATARESKPAVRFGLRDLLLLMVLVGMSLTLVLTIWRNATPIPWGGLATYVAILVGITVLAQLLVGNHGLARKYRVAAGVLLLLAVAASVAGIVVCGDWLLIGSDLGIYMLPQSIVPAEVIYIGVLVIELTLGVLLALALAALASSRAKSWHRGVAQPAAAVLLIVAILPLAVIYWHMLWLSPLPPPLTSQPNHFARIQAITDDVQRLNPLHWPVADMRAAGGESKAAAASLDALYGELLPLLDAPNFVPLDTSDIPRNKGLSPTMARIQALRHLGRCLDSESHHAAAQKDFERSAELALANIRLGTMLERGGSTIDYLVGVAIDGIGKAQLTAIRRDISPAQRRTHLADLERTLAIRESAAAVTERDSAWWERAGGWSGRLSNVLAYLRGEPPQVYLQNALDRSQAMARLLQVDLAIRIYRDEQGRLPDRLEDIGPLLPPEAAIDPYSGQSLKYRRDGEEFVLYSVGQDRRDNGGKFTNTVEYFGGSDWDLDLDMHARK